MLFENTVQSNKSKMHLLTRKLLKESFPGWSFTEEVSISIDGHSLYCDFMIPGPVAKIIIEVDGRQHDKFVKHFHKNEFQFEHNKKLDDLKQKWAEMNDFIFIRIKENHKMTADDFTDVILDAIRGAA